MVEEERLRQQQEPPLELRQQSGLMGYNDSDETKKSSTWNKWRRDDSEDE